MSRQDLDLFLEGRQPQSRTGKPIGQQLVKMNYVNDGEVKEALVRQTQERIFELLRWPRASSASPPRATCRSWRSRRRWGSTSTGS